MDSSPEALLTCREVKCEINPYKQPGCKLFHAAGSSPNSANQRGASKTSLLVGLANNLSISALAAHSPSSPSVFLFVFVSCPILLLHPSAPAGPQRGVSSLFTAGPLMDTWGLYTWEGQVQ